MRDWQGEIQISPSFSEDKDLRVLQTLSITDQIVLWYFGANRISGEENLEGCLPNVYVPKLHLPTFLDSLVNSDYFREALWSEHNQSETRDFKGRNFAFWIYGRIQVRALACHSREPNILSFRNEQRFERINLLKNHKKTSQYLNKYPCSCRKSCKKMSMIWVTSHGILC